MPKYNDNIHVWLNSKTGNTLNFKAFNGERDPVKGLYKRIIFPHRFDYPEAIIYKNSEIFKIYYQGVDVGTRKYDYWYGPEISRYKLKLILKEDNKYIGPFYSNAIALVDNQIQLLIDEYINGVYKGKFASAIIVDLKQDKIVRKF